jgi:hypothetical protein
MLTYCDQLLSLLVCTYKATSDGLEKCSFFFIKPIIDPYIRDSELKIVGEYGLRNKREVWRVLLTLSKIRRAAR